MTPDEKGQICRREWRKGRSDSLRAVDDALSRWRSWRLSDRASGLGFPSCSIEQRAGMGRGGGGALPSWDDEMRIEAAIQTYRASEPDSFVTAMLILEVPDLLPVHQRRNKCLRRNCRAWSADQKARALGIPRERMYRRYDGFRWWMKGRLEL